MPTIITKFELGDRVKTSRGGKHEISGVISVIKIYMFKESKTTIYKLRNDPSHWYNERGMKHDPL